MEKVSNLKKSTKENNKERKGTTSKNKKKGIR